MTGALFNHFPLHFSIKIYTYFPTNCGPCITSPWRSFCYT